MITVLRHCLICSRNFSGVLVLETSLIFPALYLATSRAGWLGYYVTIVTVCFARTFSKPLDGTTKGILSGNFIINSSIYSRVASSYFNLPFISMVDDLLIHSRASKVMFYCQKTTGVLKSLGYFIFSQNNPLLCAVLKVLPIPLIQDFMMLCNFSRSNTLVV